ncbi:MAG TPA: hypothetical protein VFC92_04570 [Bacteroidales bacterium]|nr:hypothetical protein [Bacteroidales bacterium]
MDEAAVAELVEVLVRSIFTGYACFFIDGLKFRIRCRPFLWGCNLRFPSTWFDFAHHPTLREGFIRYSFFFFIPKFLFLNIEPQKIEPQNEEVKEGESSGTVA